jgi:hypothetical protein
VDPELRSVLKRYTFVAIVLAAAVVWTVVYTTDTALRAPPPEVPAPPMPPAPGETEADEIFAKPDPSMQRGAPPPPAPSAEAKAPSLSSLLVTKDGARRIACGPACRLEAYCKLRDIDVCLSNSCDGDVRKLSRSDFELASASDCAQAAAAPCEEACWRKGECAGDHADDLRCTNACLTLVRQRPMAVFSESRCILESSCADLPLCAR